MVRASRALLLFALALALVGVRCDPPGAPTPVGAGFRWSPYGLGGVPDPGPAYWIGVAQQMTQALPGSVPRGIWIACEVDFSDGGCWIDAVGSASDPLIRFTGNPDDPTEAALSAFDAAGVQIWLQVEPGFASVTELIDILLDRYGHHPCVIGVGVDVEWYQNASEPALGSPVGDAEAAAWRAAVRAHDVSYRLFLKHWLPGHMPPTQRTSIVFVDDSQDLGSLDQMAAEFAVWGATFAPAQVAFQVGYDSDRSWWEPFADPPAVIAERLATEVPNLRGLYWVDFTALDVFP